MYEAFQILYAYKIKRDLLNAILNQISHASIK